MTPPYKPAVILISENKDTAIHFPPLPCGIFVEGAGFGGDTAAAIDWVGTCSTLLYWGDLDAAGPEILNDYLYERLTDPVWDGYRRIEQERVDAFSTNSARCPYSAQPFRTIDRVDALLCRDPLPPTLPRNGSSSDTVITLEDEH
ncbi:MAG: Wadjet anti-phage system protein JetD domain-containing protein [Pseudonocardiaceae bacterium]